MNMKITSMIACSLLAYAPYIFVSAPPDRPLSPNSLLATCKMNPESKIVAAQSGDLLTAIIQQDEAPALLYVFGQHGLQPNALNKDGHPVFIALSTIEKWEKTSEEMYFTIARGLELFPGGVFGEPTDCQFCANAICDQAGIKADGQWHPPIMCSPRTKYIKNKYPECRKKRKYALSSYLPHLLKIGCLVTVKAQSCDEFNGKSYQQILRDAQVAEHK